MLVRLEALGLTMVPPGFVGSPETETFFFDEDLTSSMFNGLPRLRVDEAWRGLEALGDVGEGEAK